MRLHRMSAYHNRQILCSTLLAYSVYSTVGRAQEETHEVHADVAAVGLVFEDTHCLP